MQLYELACSYVHELACSSMSFHAVPWAYMKFHEHACSFMSLYAVPFFVWAAYKNFAMLVFEDSPRSATQIYPEGLFTLPVWNWFGINCDIQAVWELNLLSQFLNWNGSVNRDICVNSRAYVDVERKLTKENVNCGFKVGQRNILAAKTQLYKSWCGLAVWVQCWKSASFHGSL